MTGRRALVRAAPDDPRQARRDRRRAAGRPGLSTSASTAHVAWTHTVSTARRFTPLRAEARSPAIRRVPGRRPRRDDAPAHGAGKVGRRDPPHTFYETRWGPVARAVPDATLTWTASTAYALADVNADKLRLANQWAQWNRARSVATAAARRPRDPGQPVGQLDRRRRPRQRLLRRRRRWCRTSTPLLRRAAPRRRGAPLLLGAGGIAARRLPRGVPLPGNDREAAAHGHPRPEGAAADDARRDYVVNSNDSYWLPNARCA